MTDTQIAKIMELADRYAETRHKCGSHLYNASTDDARSALESALRASAIPVEPVATDAVLRYSGSSIGGCGDKCKTPSACQVYAECLNQAEPLRCDGCGKTIEDHGPMLRCDYIAATPVIESAPELAKLQNAETVHSAMLHGQIAKISMEQCAHVHGEEMVNRWNAAIPEGWKIVPIEPTEEMLDYAVSFAVSVCIGGNYSWTDYMRDLWKQILSAPVSAPEVEK